MLTYFPNFFSKRAMLCYFITLLLVSVLFMSRAMPFQFMLFGIVSVFLFFNYTHSKLFKGHRNVISGFGTYIII